MPQLSNCDLLIFRDTPELWDINSDELIKQLSDAVVDNGFLIIVGKYQLTEPEKAIDSMVNGLDGHNGHYFKGILQAITRTIDKSNLNLIASKSESITSMALMCRKVSKQKNIPENSGIFEVTAERYEKWFKEIKNCLLKK